MTDNSHLFKGGRKRPSQPPYKRVEVITIATTFESGGKHQAVVLLRKAKDLYEPLLLEVFDTKLDALQRAHYINANKVMRSDGTFMHLIAEADSTANLRAKGYQL